MNHYLVELDTRSFTHRLLVIANNEADATQRAEEILRQFWNDWCKKTGADPDYIEECDTNIELMEPDRVYTY